MTNEIESLLLVIPSGKLLLPLLAEDSEFTILFLFDNAGVYELWHQVCRHLAILQFLFQHRDLLLQNVVVINLRSILLFFKKAGFFLVCNLLLCPPSFPTILDQFVGSTFGFYVNIQYYLCRIQY